MSVRILLGASVLALAVHGNASAAPTTSLADDAKAFGVRESVRGASLSPSGNKILLMRSGPGRGQFVEVVDVATGDAKTIVRTNAAPEKLHWCEFGSDTRVVCRYGVERHEDGKIIGMSRLVAMDADGGNMKLLGARQGADAYGNNQFDGTIIDWLPDSPGSVLMARNYLPQVQTGSNIRDAVGLGVDQVDLTTTKARRVEAPHVDVDGYISDGRGKVRIQYAREHREGQLTGRTSFRYRAAGSSSWKPFSMYNSTGNEGDYPIAVDGGSNAAYVLSKTDGRDALYRVSLDGSLSRSLVASNPAVDISSIVRVGRGQKIIGYTYSDDRRRTVYFDPEFDQLAKSLGRALPGGQSVHFEGATGNAGKLLVFATSDTKPGTYYLLDRATKQMSPVVDVRPELEQRALAPVKTITFAGPDGARIPAYLTVPAGSGKNLPAIVLPHGGPSARDEWGFDWLSQFLAARGFAVIQPNYRGSAGYGEQWMGENGFRDWQKSIGDITAAGRHLVSAGIADPKRLVILGWSYGGYAALQSSAVDPTLFKAAVAIAPVTDLSLLKREASGFSNSKIVSTFVGTGDHLVQGSPLQRAAAIKVPVLLVHGDMDSNVSSLHSVRMAEALRKNGTTVDLLRYKDLDHQLDDSNARTEMLTRIGTFLESAVGK